MALLLQSTAYTRLFLMVQSVDHVSGLTGASPIVQLSKAGGLMATAGATIAEVTGGNGWYKASLTTTDTNTLGDLAFHVTATSGDPTDFVDQVSNYIDRADALLDRDMSLGTDSGGTTVRTVRQALRFLRNKWAISGSTLTIYKEDDTASSWTSALTTTPGANPVTTSDPAG
jgi:hypothetical protein